MEDKKIERMFETLVAKIAEYMETGEGFGEVLRLVREIEDMLSTVENIDRQMAERLGARFLDIKKYLFANLMMPYYHMSSQVTTNTYHDSLRLISHIRFDSFLEKCQKQECPAFTGGENLLQLLVAISLEGHTLWKAQEYSESGDGADENANYHRARNRIVNCVLGCSHLLPAKSPLLDLLDIDSKHVMGQSETKWIPAAARRRKAFWAFLHEERRHGRHTEHYKAAEEFMKTLVPLTLISTKVCSADQGDKAKEILSRSFYMANVLDLYRFCVIRQKVWIYSERCALEFRDRENSG